MRCVAGGGKVLVSSMKKLRIINLGRSLGSLPALALAGALCLSMTGPALADFESAMAAYEEGSYQEAQTEFEALATAGDERAEPYLERIREKLGDDQQTDEAGTTTLMDSISSFFSGSDRPSIDSKSKSATRDTGSFFTGESPEGASGGKPADWEPWSPFDQSVDRAPPPSPVSDVVNPQRRSIWSTIFHLPGDATVIGLQYVAQSLSADNLS